MADLDPPDDGTDPFDLARFVDAQTINFEQALLELRDGRKRSHWMWYVFPQCAGLGSSPMSVRYAIRSLDEASAYLRHPLLGARLRASVAAVLSHRHRSAHEILGAPDDAKLRSSATLFALVAPGDVFDDVLTQFFGGEPDQETLRLMRTGTSPGLT